jgi:hypothetical protein
MYPFSVNNAVASMGIRRAISSRFNWVVTSTYGDAPGLPLFGAGGSVLLSDFATGWIVRPLPRKADLRALHSCHFGVWSLVLYGRVSTLLTIHHHTC